MGNWNSNAIDDEPDISSSNESEENCEMHQPKELLSVDSSIMVKTSNLHLDMDAINPQSTLTRNLDFTSITLSSIRDMENYLDDFEKASLIFILSEHVQDCIDKVSLYEWAERESKVNNIWRGKIMEALSIIQNYQIPKKYGFTRDVLMKEFFPGHYFTTKYISKFRKIIYCFCEKLTSLDEELFLKNIAGDMLSKGFKFEEYPFMEMNFSYFLHTGYITETDVRNCLQILKVMDYEQLYDMLKMINPEKETFVRSVPTAIGDDQEIKYRKVNPMDRNFTVKFGREYNSLESNISNSTQDNTQGSRHSTSNDLIRNISKDSDDIYDTSNNKIALIIDQENFYTETNPEYKDLLPENIQKEQLHSRMGTSCDSEKLDETLTKRNFKVKLRRNLTHLKMISELKAAVNEIDEKNCSCFLVCILSHGDDGVIYGCNSCYVEIFSIIEVMSDIKLDEIPKVLVVQACQGPILQKARRKIDNLEADVPSVNIQPSIKIPDLRRLARRGNNDLEVDGPSVKVQPSMKIPDFLIFWSTVPGFGAVRHRINGSWFIQSLCKHLEEADDHEHFEDICRKVMKEVSNKKCLLENDECYMVPHKDTSLTKKLFL